MKQSHIAWLNISTSINLSEHYLNKIIGALPPHLMQHNLIHAKPDIQIHDRIGCNSIFITDYKNYMRNNDFIFLALGMFVSVVLINLLMTKNSRSWLNNPIAEVILPRREPASSISTYRCKPRQTYLGKNGLTPSRSF
jgi:hypothetical protein